MSKIKAVPCRCGGEALLYEAQNVVRDKKTYYAVICKQCGIGTRWSTSSKQALDEWKNVMKERSNTPVYDENIQQYVCEYCCCPVEEIDIYCYQCGSKLNWKKEGEYETQND